MTHVSQIAGASRAAKGFVFVKMTQQVRSDELRGLRRFRDDYPQATAFFVYAGSRRRHDAGIEIVPAEDALRGLDRMIA